jgi:hypothetical protein
VARVQSIIRRRRDTALTSALQWFETGLLAREETLTGLVTLTRTSVTEETACKRCSSERGRHEEIVALVSGRHGCICYKFARLGEGAALSPTPTRRMGFATAIHTRAVRR